jgi:TPR repeat protein
MKYFYRNILPVLLVVTSLFLSASASASEVINHSSNVFKFQQKLADKGNTQAQYKLGFMYETNIEQALHWYERAAKAGLKSAEHRNTYLMVKELGFNRDMHMDWIKSVKVGAANHNADAMLLLGQLYRQGLGVKKDLKKSLDLLTQVSVLGAAEVEDEIVAIQSEMTATKKSKIAARSNNKRLTVSKSVQKAASNVQQAQIKKEHVQVQPPERQQIAKKSVVDKQPVTAAKKAAAIKAEKRRKYEAVMKQLQLEQQLIDEQQAWSTGGEVASVDDEI